MGLWNGGEMLVLSLYLQQVLHESPLLTGLIIAPQGVVGFAAGVIGPRLAGKMGVRRLLVLTAAQLEERMHVDARGIDLVVGAKGSALQIILSSVYQLDVPTGTIAWTAAQQIASRAATVRRYQCSSVSA